MTDAPTHAIDRRKFLARSAATGALVWSAPAVLHAGAVHAQGSPPPGGPRAIKITDPWPNEGYNGTYFDQTFSVPVAAGDTIVISSTSDGTQPIFVDDNLYLTVTHADASTGNDFYTGTGCDGPAEGPQIMNVTAAFEPGTNSARVTLDNDCGGAGNSTALWFVINP